MLKAFKYAQRYVGLLRKYYADPLTPSVHSDISRGELILSNDGVSWMRPYRCTDMAAWSYAAPFEHEGHLCLVAKQGSSPSLFRTRIDGLACCVADVEGSFCTRSFVMPEAQLYLNADCRGGLIMVELLDGSGRTIDGCAGGECAYENVDHVALPIRWGKKTTSYYAGRTAHLRLRLSRARVFAISEK